MKKESGGKKRLEGEQQGLRGQWGGNYRQEKVQSDNWATCVFSIQKNGYAGVGTGRKTGTTVANMKTGQSRIAEPALRNETKTPGLPGLLQCECGRDCK